MDLDLAQVRAFVAVAEHRSFRRAAHELSITQQGLSERIARLEEELGTRLFDRAAAPVGLTDAGERFLAPARTALAAGAEALTAARGLDGPLRLDVWGHLFAPLRTVREVLAAHPGPPAEVGPGCDLPAAVAALTRGDIDAGFGRYHALPGRGAGPHRTAAPPQGAPDPAAGGPRSGRTATLGGWRLADGPAPGIPGRTVLRSHWRITDDRAGATGRDWLAGDAPAVAASAVTGPAVTDPAVTGAAVTDPAPAGGAVLHRLVRLEPVDAVLPADHPLAREASLRPEQLRALRLVLPAAPERLDFLRRFAEEFRVPMAPGEVNLGLDHLLERVRTTPDGFTLLPAELPLAPAAGLAVVPLTDPTPLYAWSLIWHRDRPHPAVPALLRTFAEVGRHRRWPEYRPGRDWLPEADARDAENGRPAENG